MSDLSSVFRLALPAVSGSPADPSLGESSVDALLREAVRLGVFAAVYSNLRQAGVRPAGENWTRRFQANSVRNLFLKREQEPLLALLRVAGLPSLPVRGIALTETLYPDLEWREIADIDLLVRPADVAQAYEVLKGAGLADAENPWNEKALGKLARRPAYLYPELRLTGSHGLSVELHWDWVEPTLPEDDLFRDLEGYLVYLCRHAGKHFWMDVRWLADIELLLRREGERLDWERFWSVARRVDAVRSCAGSFALCARLFRRRLGAAERRFGTGAGKRLTRGAEEWLVEGKTGRFRDRLLVQVLRVDGNTARVRRVLSWMAPAPRHWTQADGSTPPAWDVWLARYRRLALRALAAACPVAGWRRLLSKAAELPSRDWSALLGAWLLLPVMGAGARRTRFPQLQAWAGVVRKVDAPRHSVARARHLAELVDAAARRHLVRYECLPRSLTLLRLLGREGIRAKLKMGVRKENGKVLGHAWVECAGEVVNDAKGPGEQFAVLEPAGGDDD